MQNNRATLRRLFAENAIDLQEAPLLDHGPPLPRIGVDFDKVEGMLLGLAVGDALGITTESWLPHERREAHGEIRDYLPNRYVNECKGFPSDDSQMAFWTLEQLLLDDGLNATPQLVESVDAVETSRGFEPPIFVDIRIRRNVWAKGFVGNAFEKLLGPSGMGSG
jgi:hypothetical protein